jgi:hypothetical protein
VFADDIDDVAAGEVREGDTECVGADGLHYLSAVNTLVEPHFLFVSRSLAIPTGLVRFLPRNVQCPHTK